MVTRDDNLWVVVRLGGTLYGLPTVAVREMTSLPVVTTLPQAGSTVRGMVNLRGQALALLDLRARLGLRTAAAALDELLTTFLAREEDHRRWISELDACITSGRQFTLALDPTQCAFGRWYGSLTTEDVVLAAQLRKIEGPHRRVHARGAQAIAALQAGNADVARALAHDIRTRDLAMTLALFAETRQVLKDAQRELAVVVIGNGTTFAATVDSVEAIERLAPADGANLAALDVGAQQLVSGVGRRPRDEAMVLLLDPSRLLVA